MTPGFSGSISINSPALPAMQNWRLGAGLCAGGERTPQISKIRLSTPHKRYCGEDRFLPRVDQGYPAAIPQQMRRRFGRLFRDWNNFDGAHGPWPERAEMSVAIPSLWNRPFHYSRKKGPFCNPTLIWGKSQCGPFISANARPDEPHLESRWPRERHIRLALTYLTAHLSRRLSLLGSESSGDRRGGGARRAK